MRKYYKDWGRVGGTGCILMDDELKVGLYWSRLFTTEKISYDFVNEETPELTIALNTKYRNRGLGSRLINQLIEENRKKGFKKVSLSVDQESPSIRLYQRFGFQIHKEEGTAFTMLRMIDQRTK